MMDAALKPLYVVDSSVWLDFRTVLMVPGSQEFLDRIVNEHRLVVPEEVVKEVHPSGGSIGRWVNDQRDCHRDTEPMWERACAIADAYPDLVIYEKKNGADPFVIACALRERESQNDGMFSVEVVVVTNEKSRGPSRICIPDACKSEGIRPIDLNGWFVEEGRGIA